MPSINITPDPIKVAKLEAGLADTPNLISLAGRDALNKSMQHGVAVSATDLAKEMTASRGAVRKRLTFYKATKSNLSAAMIVRGGRGVNLAGFGARQTQAGISVRVLGQRTIIAHAFMAKGLSGTGGFNLGPTGQNIVALREGEKRPMKMGRYAGMKILRGPRAGQLLTRQPIVSQQGPTVAEIWEKTPGIAEHTTNEVNESLGPNIDSQLTRYWDMYA